MKHFDLKYYLLITLGVSLTVWVWIFVYLNFD